jgi:replicative DNA helicase
MTSLPRVEYELLQLLLHDVSSLTQVQQQITPDDFQEPVLRDIYRLLLRLAPNGVQVLFPSIHEQAENAEQRQVLAKMVAEFVFADAEERCKALHDYLYHMRQRRIQVQIRGLKAQIREAEQRGDAAAQQRLLQEYTALSRGRRWSNQRGAS